MNTFQYLAPRTLAEVLEISNLHKEKVKLLAGGTDLIPQLKENKVSPKLLIDIKKVKDLYGVAEEGKGLILGALTPLDELANCPLLREKVPYFTQALLMIGSYQVRCRGTLGGNLCNASPAADSAPILLALGASLKIQSIEGIRMVPLDKFFLGPGKTSLRANEILTHIYIPLPEEKTHGVFLKHTKRRAMDLAIVNIGVLLKKSQRDHCHDLRIALGAVAPIPMRLFVVEKMFAEKDITPSLIMQAREAVSKTISPISDLRGSLEYRKEIAGVFFERAFKILLEKESEKNA